MHIYKQYKIYLYIDTHTYAGNVIYIYTYILECHKHILDIHIGTVINKAIKYTLFCLIVLKYKLLTKVKTRALYFAL